MTACAILVIDLMTTSIPVVMRSKILLIRVTMVIIYLSGTPPGFSLSARFLAGRCPSGAGVPKNAADPDGCAPPGVFSET
jgi:hypothetical protein